MVLTFDVSSLLGHLTTRGITTVRLLVACDVIYGSSHFRFGFKIYIKNQPLPTSRQDLENLYFYIALARILWIYLPRSVN
jgi:hypothetical protein